MVRAHNLVLFPAGWGEEAFSFSLLRIWLLLGFLKWRKFANPQTRKNNILGRERKKSLEFNHREIELEGIWKNFLIKNLVSRKLINKYSGSVFSLPLLGPSL